MRRKTVGAVRGGSAALTASSRARAPTASSISREQELRKARVARGIGLTRRGSGDSTAAVSSARQSQQAVEDDEIIDVPGVERRPATFMEQGSDEVRQAQQDRFVQRFEELQQDMQRAAENHSDLLTQLQEAKIEAATEAKARVAAESRADALADANTTLSRSMETLSSKWDEAQARNQVELAEAEEKISEALQQQSEIESRAIAAEAHAAELEQRLEGAETECRRLEGELDSSRKQQDALSVAVGKLEAKLETKDAELNAAAQEAAKNTERSRALQEERFQLERQIASAEAKVEIEKERSASAIAVREERLVGLQLQIDRLQAEAASLVDARDRAMAEVVAEQKRTAAAERRTDEQRQASLNSEALSAQAIEEASKQLAAVEAVRQVEAAATAEARMRQQELQVQLTASEKTIGQARSEASSARADVAALSARAEAAVGAETELKTLRDTVSQQQQSLRKAEGQIDTLRMSIRYSSPPGPPIVEASLGATPAATPSVPLASTGGHHVINRVRTSPGQALLAGAVEHLLSPRYSVESKVEALALAAAARVAAASSSISSSPQTPASQAAGSVTNDLHRGGFAQIYGGTGAWRTPNQWRGV